jgi:flagellar biosynthesis/type III secretory pathway protein FliH
MNQILHRAQQRARELLEQGRNEGLLEGRKEGLLEGRNEGLLEGQRRALFDLCEVLDIEVSDLRRARIESLDLAGLDALRAQLKKLRAWPDDSAQ